MTLYVFDTDTLSLFHHGHATIGQYVGAHQPDELAITVITVEEQLTGWYSLLRSVKQTDELARVYTQLARAVKALAEWQILEYTLAAISRYEQLKSQKLNIGKQDLRIAAITLEYGGILVTRNTRDFRRVPGLTLEDWTV